VALFAAEGTPRRPPPPPAVLAGDAHSSRSSLSLLPLSDERPINGILGDDSSDLVSSNSYYDDPCKSSVVASAPAPAAAAAAGFVDLYAAAVAAPAVTVAHGRRGGGVRRGRGGIGERVRGDAKHATGGARPKLQMADLKQ